jgi:hypothetical protein
VVYLPQGRDRVTGLRQIENKGIVLRGDGPGKTLLATSELPVVVELGHEDVVVPL